MTTCDVTGGPSRELTKYRITLAASLAALVLAGLVSQTAYDQHVRTLRIGDQIGERMQMRGFITSQEGAHHGQR